MFIVAQICREHKHRVLANEKAAERTFVSIQNCHCFIYFEANTSQKNVVEKVLLVFLAKIYEDNNIYLL